MTNPTANSCGVCGASVPLPHCAPTAEMAPDLDFRPGEPARSTLAQWMLVCRGCGAVAPDLRQLTPDAREVIDSAAYQALRGNGRKFRRYAAICQAKGNLREAGNAMLQAAWSADDAGDTAQARLWRLEAAGLWVPPVDEETALRRIDALRRAGEFAAAGTEATAWTPRIHHESGSHILAFQLARIAAADSGVYRISSVLRPPAHTPHGVQGKRPARKGLWARLFGK